MSVQFTAYTFAVTRRRADACARDGRLDELWFVDDETGGTFDLGDPDLQSDPELLDLSTRLLKHIDCSDEWALVEDY